MTSIKRKLLFMTYCGYLERDFLGSCLSGSVNCESGGRRDIMH